MVLSPDKEDYPRKKAGQKWFEEFCDKEPYPCLNFYDVLKETGDPEPYFIDGVHYNNKGNKLLAETILSFLNVEGNNLKSDPVQ